VKVFTLSMVFGLAVAGVAFAQGSTLMSGYTKTTANFISAPSKAPARQAAKTNFIKVSTDAKAPTYVYKAPMATRPLKTW